MKIFRYSLLVALFMVLLLPVLVVGQEKEKRINRTFDVSPSTELAVDNQFGRVHVNTWDKSQIQVEVVIKAEMRNEEKSQDFIDRVEIDISESSSLISLKTDYGNKMNSRKGESFSVDYTISMPEVGDLDVRNKFGDIYVGDIKGALNVVLKYGSMRGGKLLGDSDIELGFGNADIEELGNTRLDIKYSDLEVEKTKDIDLDQQFSNIRIDEMSEVDLRSKYGSVELGLVKSVDGSAGFTDFEIRELLSQAKLDLEYVGGFRIEKVRKGFELIKIDAQFTSMDITLDNNVNGQFDGVFKFSDLNKRGDRLDLNYIKKDMHRNEYKGKIGDGGPGTISVDSGYGDLKLGFTN